MERLLTINEFAEAVRLSPTTIKRHISNGDIEVLRYGGNQPVRIEESQIEQFIEKAFARKQGCKVVQHGIRIVI